MSWNNFEYSTSDGRPLTLYEFIRGGTKHYRYTNTDKDMVINGDTWRAEAVSNSGISIGNGRNLEITAPADNDVAKLFRGVPPSEPIRVTVYRLHIDDDMAEMRIVWVGIVKEVKREELDRIKFITASVASAFTRIGLRLTYSRACPFALYDHNCRVNSERYELANLTIEALNGAEITVNLPSNIENGYFSGGFMSWKIDGVLERRGLKKQDNNTIGILGGTHGLKVGMTISLYPGCDRTIDTCDKKYGNHLNYGGQPHMPGISPFQIIKLF